LLAIATLQVRGFRNLATQTVELSPRFNVLAGDNGQGKTNVLEAIYLATTAKSFRTTTFVDCVAHGASSAHVRASIVDDRDVGAPAREQAIDLVEGRRKPLIDGKRPASHAAFALATPIVVFEPSSLRLSQGPSSERRKLLDRVAFHLAAANGGSAMLLDSAARYRHALASRKRLLARGDARMLEPYEKLMAEHGVRIVRARREASDSIVSATVRAFEDITRSGVALDLHYAPRGPEDPEDFARMLEDSREKDARRGTTSVGPHRDDLVVTLGTHPAQKVASQGQHRAIVLALKSAELATIAHARGVDPILLLDDVSSELDPSRNAALFAFLHAQVGQVVLTTTRPEVIELHSDRTDFRVRAGSVVRA